MEFGGGARVGPSERLSERSGLARSMFSGREIFLRLFSHTMTARGLSTRNLVHERVSLVHVSG